MCTLIALLLTILCGLCRAQAQFQTQAHDLDASTRMQRRTCFAPRFARFRTLNGLCNNRRRPRDGAADTHFIVQSRPLRRLPQTMNLPSARLISNIVCEEARPRINRRGMSELVTFFGQLLDHTVTATDTNRLRPLNIEVPLNDPVFKPGSFLPFSRTVTRGRNAPLNRLTSFVDAASVYGFKKNLSRSLRLLDGGRLYLPNNILPRGPLGQFLAGDDRVTENPNLVALHLIFAREHNTVAAEVATAFPRYNDEQIYELARHIVAAEMQAITFHEFLPALTGRKLPRYRGYNPKSTAAISTRFSTVAFRVGHTLLNSTVTTIDARGGTRTHKLRDAFFNADMFVRDGIDSFFRGMLSGHASEVDNGVTGEVRNFLITSPRSTRQLDLVAFNIQRGRDNRVPSCNGLRHSLGLRPYTAFNQISSNPNTAARLRKAYGGRINDVDAWVCGIAEDHVRHSSLGPIFHRIVREQFARLRNADRFYFERPGYFTSEEYRKLATVRRLTGPTRQLGSIMRSVIARNTRIPIREINPQPFFV